MMNEYAMINKGVMEEDRDDNSRWELDTTPLLDSFYHELLGETEGEGGMWVRDHSLKRWMNEKGASYIKSELKARIDKITLLSRLEDTFIIDSLNQLGKTVADMFFTFYEEWEINPSPSNLKSLANMIVEKVEITYQSAKNGGIREYRVRAKNGGSTGMGMMPGMGGFPGNFSMTHYDNDGNGGVM